MSDVQNSLRVEEYRALRATIQQRGTVRVIVAVLTFSVWAVTILLVSMRFGLPFFSLIPLMVLFAGFEAVFALHIGVERIGRYIQAHHEPASSGQARWEQTAMEFRRPGAGANPLFVTVFIGATLINLTLGLLNGLDETEPFSFANSGEWLPVALLHFVVIARVAMASRFAATQRALDLDEYRRLLK